MAGWGRNAAEADLAPSQIRYGRRSIMFAFLALFLVILSFVVLENLPKDTTDDVTSFFSGATVVAFALVAPILHAIGFGYGVAGLARSTTGKGSSVVGILLNIALFGAGIGLVYFAADAVTAFR